MLNWESFKAGVMRLENVTDCAFAEVGDEYLVEIESYVADDKGRIERARAPILIRKSDVEADGWPEPAQRFMSAFERGFADRHEGYTRYATPDEVEAYKRANRNESQADA